MRRLIPMTALLLLGCERRVDVAELVASRAHVLLMAGTSTTIRVQARDGSGAPLDGVSLSWMVPAARGLGTVDPACETATEQVDGVQVEGVCARRLAADLEVLDGAEVPIVVTADEAGLAALAIGVTLRLPPSQAQVTPLAACAAVSIGGPVTVRAQTAIGDQPVDGITVDAHVLPNGAGIRIAGGDGVEATAAAAVSRTRTYEGAQVRGLVEFTLTTTATTPGARAIVTFAAPSSQLSPGAMSIEVARTATVACTP